MTAAPCEPRSSTIEVVAPQGADPAARPSALAQIQQMVAKYQRPALGRSLWQLTNTLIPYLLLWIGMYVSLGVSYWLTLLLAIPAAGLLVRIFIIFHDCGHGSFFLNRRANNLVGFFTGVLTFTPYHAWRHDHAVHHANAGDLSRRGVGDIMLLTVEEYLCLPGWRRAAYRLSLNPIVLIGILPTLKFVFGHRFARRGSGRRERFSVYWTNLALAGIAGLFGLTVGFQAWVLIQLPVIVLAASAGVCLFYLQHHFEGAYWADHEEWDYLSAALAGSSLLLLPGLLEWFTGCIGFHHVHHLNPRIPNYFLRRCHQEVPVLREVRVLTLRSSLKALQVKVWNAQQGRLVNLKDVKAVR